MAFLEVVAGGPANLTFDLDGRKEYRIGRTEQNHIVLRQDAVSSNHALITVEKDRYSIVDCRSKNKTYVNGEQLIPYKPRVLNDNDRIKICDWVLLFRVGSTSIEVSDEDSSSTVRHTIEMSSQGKYLESQTATGLRTLLEFTKSLSAVFDEHGVIIRLTSILARIFPRADRLFVILRNEQTGKLDLADFQPLTLQAERTVRYSRTIADKVLGSAEALLFDASSLPDDSGTEPKSIVESRIRSAIVAPLLGRAGHAFGLVQLDVQDKKRAFSQEDLALLVGMASYAALAIENIKLYKIEQDFKSARRAQLSFLPSTSPKVAGYEFHAYYEPARNVGGDYYDFIEREGNLLGVFVGDVVGKGMAAALIMAKLSAQVRACMLAERDLVHAIARLNELLQQSDETGRFITLVASVLDPTAHRVSLLSAGHPSPLIYRRQSNSVETAIETDETGFPLGVESDLKCRLKVIDLNPGDSLIYFTDGVTEACNSGNKQFGRSGTMQAILAALRSDGRAFTPRQIGERIINAVNDYQADKEQDDDIALVCFGRSGNSLSVPNTESFDLGASPAWTQ